jgi:predicted nucleic acid-binding protein
MIVLDASVAAKVYLEERGSEEATAILTSTQKLMAPELVRTEVCAALCRRVRHGQLEAEEARVRCSHWLGRLQKGLFALTPDKELLEDAIELSSELKHALQDCLYLAMARRFDIPLITADRVFRDRTLHFDGRVVLLMGCEAN